MIQLNVTIEISGEETLCGRLLGDSSGDARFIYDENYLSSDKAEPVSLGLPLRKEA